MKLIRIGLIIFLLFVVPSVYAVTISINQYPSSFDQNQEVEIGFSMGCSNCGNSYIRGVFFPDGTNYFGLTKNNIGDWVGTATDKTQYFKVAKEEITESSWSGMLKMKIDITDGAYLGPGTYSFKIGRYTSADSSAFWSEVVSMNITGPTPTHTPTPTVTNSPTPTNAPTNTPTDTPTKTPTPKNTNTPTKSPTPKKTMTPTLQGISTSTGEIVTSSGTKEENVLGAKDEDKSTSSVTFERTPSRKVFIITFLFIGIGCALFSLVLVLRKHFFQEEGVKSET